jgi:hypothetical protein
MPWVSHLIYFAYSTTARDANCVVEHTIRPMELGPPQRHQGGSPPHVPFFELVLGFWCGIAQASFQLLLPPHHARHPEVGRFNWLYTTCTVLVNVESFTASPTERRTRYYAGWGDSCILSDLQPPTLRCVVIFFWTRPDCYIFDAKLPPRNLGVSAYCQSLDWLVETNVCGSLQFAWP